MRSKLKNLTKRSYTMVTQNSKKGNFRRLGYTKVQKRKFWLNKNIKGNDRQGAVRYENWKIPTLLRMKKLRNQLI